MKVSEVKSGKLPTVVIDKAIVVYADVLGFAKKTEVSDIENTLLDFLGALTITAHEFPQIRFNVFSDNAFLATSEDNAKDLVSAIRYAFHRWSSNGILVRAGISLGTYREFFSVAIQAMSKNFTGNLFSGTAIVKSVKLEKAKEGAFLFTNNETAKFFEDKFSEHIFQIKKNKFLGWTTINSELFLFTANSLFRLIRIIELDDRTLDDVKYKLLGNLTYAKNQHEDEQYFIVALLTILNYSDIDQKIKEKTCEIFGVDDEFFKNWKKLTDLFFKTWKDEMRIMKAISDTDSSIPNFKH